MISQKNANYKNCKCECFERVQFYRQINKLLQDELEQMKFEAQKHFENYEKFIKDILQQNEEIEDRLQNQIQRGQILKEQNQILNSKLQNLQNSIYTQLSNKENEVQNQVIQIKHNFQKEISKQLQDFRLILKQKLKQKDYINELEDKLQSQMLQNKKINRKKLESSSRRFRKDFLTLTKRQNLNAQRQKTLQKIQKKFKAQKHKQRRSLRIQKNLQLAFNEVQQRDQVSLSHSMTSMSFQLQNPKKVKIQETQMCSPIFSNIFKFLHFF